MEKIVGSLLIETCLTFELTGQIYLTNQTEKCFKFEEFEFLWTLEHSEAIWKAEQILKYVLTQEQDLILRNSWTLWFELN